MVLPVDDQQMLGGAGVELDRIVAVAAGDGNDFVLHADRRFGIWNNGRFLAAYGILVNDVFRRRGGQEQTPRDHVPLHALLSEVVARGGIGGT